MSDKKDNDFLGNFVAGIITLAVLMFIAGLLGSIVGFRDTFLNDVLVGSGVCAILFVIYVWVSGLFRQSKPSDNPPPSDKKDSE